jgi:hypothetical protein
MDEIVETTTQVVPPIIVDMGRQKVKNLKALKKGEGKLWEEVQEVVDQIQEQLGERIQGQAFLPVVILYEKKTKRQRLDKLVRPYLRVLR